MKTKVFLEKMYKQGRIPQATLFYGKEGVGKRELAFELSQAILCLRSQYPSCGICESCRQLKNFFSIPEEKLSIYGESSSGKSVFLYLQGEHPDFVYLKPEKTEIKVDQIRAVREFVFVKPALSRKKVVMVYNAEKMNPYAQNALLKVLEEPPEDTFFVLVSHNLNKILPTVKSRCFALEVPPLTKEELSQKTGIKDPMLLELADGSLRLLNQLQEKKDLVELAMSFLRADFISLHKMADKVENMDTEDQVFFLKVFAHLIHQRYLQERRELYKFMLDRVHSTMEHLGKGVSLRLLLFYLRLKGGDKGALHKGSLQGYEEDYTG
ncbi:DNA polymerase III subunit [Thermocrinis sp.]